MTQPPRQRAVRKTPLNAPTTRSAVRRGRPVYVPCLGAVVQPLMRVGDQWRCQVIAAYPISRTAGFVLVAESSLATGVDPDLLNQTNVGTFPLAWLAGVHEQLPASRAFQFARVLAEHAHARGTTTVVLSREVRRRLLVAAHLRPPGLNQLLALLTDAGLLTWAQDSPDGEASITLTALTPRARTAWRRRRSITAVEQATAPSPATSTSRDLG